MSLRSCLALVTAGVLVAISGAAQELSLEFFPVNPIYAAGGTAALTLRMSEVETVTVTAAGVEVTLPEGWTFQEVSGGDAPNVQPNPGAGGLLAFMWFSTPYPPPPYEFTFTVAVPAGLADDAVSIPALGRFRVSGIEVEHQTEGVNAILYAPVPHTWYLDAAVETSGDGSQEFPFQTFAEVMSHCVAGRADVVHAATGTYTGAAVPASTTLIGDEGAHLTRIEPGPREKQNDQGVTLGDGVTVRGISFGTGDPAVLLEENAAVELRNCIVTGAVVGMDASAAGALLACVNVTFHDNGVACRLREGELHNCIFSGGAVGVDLVEGGDYSGGYNLFDGNETSVNGGAPDATSVFAAAGLVAPETGNLHLRFDSAARDAGDPDAAQNDPDGSRNDVGVDGGPFALLDLLAPEAHIARTPAEGAIEVYSSLQLDASASTDAWGIAVYEWDFDYTDDFEVQATGAVQEHVFTAPGEVRVAVRVTDHSGLSSVATIAVEVLAADVAISGQVLDGADAPLQGVLLDGGTGISAETDASGAYSLTVPKGWSGTVTPHFGSYAFTPESRAYTVLLEDAAGEDYSGSCAAPAAPANVTASDGTFGDKVQITWDAAAGATEYRVYRATVEDFSDGVALGEEWTAALTFDDTTAAAAEVSAFLGCSWFEKVETHTYYYRVVARGECGESAPSGTDAGYRGKSAKTLAADVTVMALALVFVLRMGRKRKTG